MDNNNPSKKGLKPLQILLAAVIILLILAGGLYINNKQGSKSSTKSNDSTANPNGPKYAFKELGIQVTLPNDLKDLKYSVTSPPAGGPSMTILKLNTSEFTAAANKCLGTPENTEQSFATLIKTPKTGNNPPAVESLKEFDDFYIGNLGAPLKDVTCQNSTSKKTLDELSAKLNNALKEAFKTTTKI